MLDLGLDPGRRRCATRQAIKVRGMPAELTGSPAPTLAQLPRFARRRFGPAGGERRQLGRARPADAALLERRHDLGPPATEQPAYLGRDTGQLGDAVTHRRPLDAERPRELTPQHRLIDPARSSCVPVQAPAVECRPAPVGAVADVRDHDVRMQLRVAGARRSVPEDGSDEPGGRQHDSAAPPASHGGRVAFEVAQRFGRRSVVAVSHRTLDAAVAEAEQDADALGRRERQVEGRDTSAACRPQVCYRDRMRSGEEPSQIVGLHTAREPEPRGACSGPSTGRLARVGVVRRRAAGVVVERVDALVLDLEEVVLRPAESLAIESTPCRRTRRPARLAAPTVQGCDRLGAGLFVCCKTACFNVPGASVLAFCGVARNGRQAAVARVVPGATMRYMSHPLSLRFPPRTVERLDRRARRLQLPPRTLAQRYVEEGLRMDEHPLVRFVDGPAGRRARLVGTGSDVWEVIAAVKDNDGDIAATATYLHVALGLVQAAVAYYGAFATEIDAWTERNEQAATEARSAWLAGQAALQR
jgi:hypothetical protein